jgi:hypothetical protein
MMGKDIGAAATLAPHRAREITGDRGRGTWAEDGGRRRKSQRGDWIEHCTLGRTCTRQPYTLIHPAPLKREFLSKNALSDGFEA